MFLLWRCFGRGKMNEDSAAVSRQAESRSPREVLVPDVGPSCMDIGPGLYLQSDAEVPEARTVVKRFRRAPAADTADTSRSVQPRNGPHLWVPTPKAPAGTPIHRRTAWTATRERLLSDLASGLGRGRDFPLRFWVVLMGLPREWCLRKGVWLGPPIEAQRTMQSRRLTYCIRQWPQSLVAVLRVRVPWWQGVRASLFRLGYRAHERRGQRLPVPLELCLWSCRLTSIRLDGVRYLTFGQNHCRVCVLSRAFCRRCERQLFAFAADAFTRHF